MDGLSVAASVIAVAGLAYSSSKTLHQVISGIYDAPQTLLNLKIDIGALYQAIHSLQVELEKKDKATALSEAQTLNLSEIRPALEGCRDTCDEFKAKIENLMRNSTDRHTSFRDRFKLHFQDREIATFQTRLASYKSTLAIALEFSTLKNIAKTFEATQTLEMKIEDVTTRLTSQMQGLQIGLQAFLDASAQSRESKLTNQQRELAEAQEFRVLQAIERQNVALGHCYRACMAAFKETTQATGHTYKYVSASNEAKVFMGDVGNISAGAKHTYEKINASDRADLIMGNMQGEFLKDFFKR